MKINLDLTDLRSLHVKFHMNQSNVYAHIISYSPFLIMQKNPSL